MTKLLISSILLYLLAYPAQAVILLGQDNNANQTDPGTGVPWDAVGKVTNSDGSGIQGSAIYLGEGFLLTANHVAMNLTYSFITFDEANYFSIDPNFNDGTRTYGKQVATGVDMAVIKLISTPTTPPVAASLLTTNTESFGATDSATLVGWGVGRDPSSPVGSGSITWGGVETSEKRWGVNAPRASGPVGYTLAGIDYTFEGLVTYDGSSTTGPSNTRGLGPNEASVTLYDSGSGLFQDIGGTWYLIGLTDAAGSVAPNISTYGSDGPGGGDSNIYGRVSTYETQITALVPEPSTVSLLALTAAALAGVAFRRRR